MRRFIVESGPSGFDVVDEYGRRSGQLTFGEMIEQLISLTVANSVAARQGRSPVFPMLTEDGWRERDEARQRRIEARDEAWRQRQQQMLPQ